MRVRQWAVVGAVCAVAWAGGAGVAQATDGPDPVGPACPAADLLLPEDGGAVLPLPEPCGPDALPGSEAVAQIGCTGPALLAVDVSGLEPGVAVSIVVDTRTESDPVEADEDGRAEFLVDFAPRSDGYVDYEVQYADDNPAAFGEAVVENTCGGAGTVVGARDCATPETVVLTLSVTGLEPSTEYDVVYHSDGFRPTSGAAGGAVFGDAFTTDAAGAATVTSRATEDADVLVDTGALSIDAEVYGADALTTSVVGHVDVAACPVQGTTPAPTTPTTPVATPVVVTPVAAHPAVLANTGAPVTAAALLGGGLLVVGAGALVATRRRSA